ncbi:hypothetical protein ABKN59_008210 [Abortiporus biennis]
MQLDSKVCGLPMPFTPFCENARFLRPVETFVRAHKRGSRCRRTQRGCSLCSRRRRSTYPVNVSTGLSLNACSFLFPRSFHGSKMDPIPWDITTQPLCDKVLVYTIQSARCIALMREKPNFYILSSVHSTGFPCTLATHSSWLPMNAHFQPTRPDHRLWDVSPPII